MNFFNFMHAFINDKLDAVTRPIYQWLKDEVVIVIVIVIGYVVLAGRVDEDDD